MKLTFLFLTAFIFTVNANGVSQTITYSGKDIPLKKIFTTIEKQTGYVVLTTKDVLKESKPLTVSALEMPLTDFLDLALKKQQLKYRIAAKTIMVSRKTELMEKPANPVILPVPATKAPFSGQVLAKDGEVLAGATIRIKGTNSGTTTDAQGRFSLEVDKGDVLIFSFIGFKEKEYVIGSESSATITLLESGGKELSEVVVIGYGAVKRKNITGAVSSVKTEELNKSTVTNFAQALAGRVPGVTALQTSGQPGAAVTLEIRSNPSFASAGALYVIDGVIVNDNAGEPDAGTKYGGAGVSRSPLNFINPNDIESIEFLKDASATAIYGARAGAGVVLITTKRGKDGKLSLQYDASHSFQKMLNFYNILGTKDYMVERNKMMEEKWMYDNKIGIFGNVDPSSVTPFVPKYTQQQIDEMPVQPSAIDAISRSGSTKQHNLSLSGGTTQTQYFVSGNYLSQKGVLLNSDFDRYNGRVSIDQKVGKRVKTGINVIVSNSTANNANIGTGLYENASMILAALYYPATMVLQNADGSYPINPDYQNVPNPLSYREVTDKTKSSRILTSGYGQLDILSNLSAKVSFSYDQSTSKRYSYLPKSFLYGALTEGQASINENNARSRLQEYTLNYSKTINEKHAFTAVAGHSYQVSDFDGMGAYNDHFPTDNFSYNNLGFGTATSPKVSSYRNPTRIWKSYFARAIYELNDRYFLSASLRRDGASNFAANKKWGTFPSVSAGWIISEESFVKENLPFIDFLKLRVGYGATGNSNIGASAFNYYASSSKYVFGNSLIPGVKLSQLSNDNLTWETQKDINIGTDFQLLKNRISASADYFIRTTSNLLTNSPLSTDFPVSTVAINAGKTRSRGFEIGIQTKNITAKQRGGFTWNSAINLSHYFNEWVERSPAALKSLEKYIDPKGPFNGTYGYVSDGIYTLDKEAPSWMPGIIPGSIILKDLNGYDSEGNLTGQPDGKLSTADQVLISSSAPKYNFGINNSFSYKNFDLSIYMYGIIGKKYNSDYANAFKVWEQLAQFGWNVMDITKERWTFENQNAVYPTGLASPYAEYANNSDYWVEKANFLRCRDITLGYTLPNGLIAKQNALQGLKLYANVQNPFIITKYKGMDPELQNFLAYPLVRSFTIGLNATF